VKGIICSHGYPEIIKLFSAVCAALIAIFAIVTTALIIPKDIFTIGEILGITVHRYQIIVCSGIVAYSLTYFSVKFFCCRRCCPEPPEKTEED